VLLLLYLGSDVISYARLILFFTDHASTEPLADARGTLGFHGLKITALEQQGCVCL